MPPRAHQGRKHWILRAFRACRYCLLSLLVLVLGAFLYFTQIGLPDFLKRRLQAELRAQGVELEFGRLRLQGYGGFLAEGVTLAHSRPQAGPQFTAEELVVQLDTAALRRLQLQVTSLQIRQGRLIVPVIASNEPPDELVVEQVSTELRFRPGDCWELARFQAESLGARLNLSGTLTNASAVREWSARQPATTASSLWQWHLRRALRLARQVQFSRPPDLTIRLQGDARDPTGFTAEVSSRAENADTAWGTLGGFALTARLNQPSGTNGLGLSDLKLEISEARTRWGELRRGLLEIHYAQSFTNPFPAAADWNLDLAGVHTPWGETDRIHLQAHGCQPPDQPGRLRTQLSLTSDGLLIAPGKSGTNQLTAEMLHDGTSPIPLRADWRLRVTEPESALGHAREVQFTGRLTRRVVESPRQANADWAWWAWLEPVQLEWEGSLDQVEFTNAVADRVAFSGRWNAPDLTVGRLHADLYERQLDATARVNVATRQVEANCGFNFDVYRVISLLTPKAQKWLRQYTWQEPPEVNGQIRATLPAWTNAHPDWRVEVLPTLRLDGFFRGSNAFFRDIPVSTAQSHFTFSNQVWHLPDLVVTRPEGRVELAHRADSRTRDYSFDLRGQIDPQVLRPLVPEPQQKAFDFFRFTGPPLVEGVITGRYHARERTAFHAHVIATNFVFRDEVVSFLESQIQFTNRFLWATNTTLRSGPEWALAPGVGFDFDARTLFLTNVTAVMDPQRVARAIGPKTARILSPYSFKQPTAARVDGSVNVREKEKADLSFDLSGGPFSYWKLNAPEIRGLVRWRGQSVTISNLLARFYEGHLAGDFAFDVSAPSNTLFRFQTTVSNVNFHALMSDLQSPTNRLEGLLNGDWGIDRADTGDWESWQGWGRASLREGFLWDIPLFGIFSPALDAVLPGVGKSRVSGLTATFTITNSVIHTDDLELRSPAMRLAYRGTFDFHGNVNARVEARLLRDVWIVGPLVSLVFKPLTKLFEYKVTGTLSQPRKEPLRIPKPLQLPLRPWQTLKEIFGAEGEANKPPPGADGGKP
jgi:hypothetical protein